jgi:LytS/YehU family sensor histidine kinase
MIQSARLLALQARVEPQFLFDVLHRVRDLIGQSTLAAERLLGDLIALLREMQPATGATASSVEREYGIVHAYARASEAAALQEPRLQLHADDAARKARLAPLVLLPALRCLVGDAPDAGWQVAARAIDGRLQVVVAPTGNVAAAATALACLDIAPLRQRLAAVHGDAHLAINLDDRPALRIDTPFQTDDPGPDR